MKIAETIWPYQEVASKDATLTPYRGTYQSQIAYNTRAATAAATSARIQIIFKSSLRCGIILEFHITSPLGEVSEHFRSGLLVSGGIARARFVGEWDWRRLGCRH